MSTAYIQSKIEDENLDVDIVDVIVSGSRCRGIENNKSDLDMVVEYKGLIREDDLFNILNEEGLEIAGVRVDINPITERKSGTLEEYLPNVEKYLEEKKHKASIKERIRGKRLEVCVKGWGDDKGRMKQIENVR